MFLILKFPVKMYSIHIPPIKLVPYNRIIVRNISLFVNKDLCSKAIRQKFLDFFISENNHKFIKSSPVIPFCDPSIAFVNAGMNQVTSKICYLIKHFIILIFSLKVFSLDLSHLLMIELLIVKSVSEWGENTMI